jgi:hypothetical protein
VALHRTYERLLRQPQTMNAAALASLDFENLFDALRERDIALQPTIASGKTSVEKRTRCLVLVTRRWVSEIACAIGDRVLARYGDGNDWWPGAVTAVRHSLGARIDSDSLAGVVYDVEYDDGDYEEDVPLERVLSVEHEPGHWEYIVVGPEEASASLPNDQQHPWWPTAEYFVDFVVIEAKPSLLAKEVGALRETAAERYGPVESVRPWPLENLDLKVRSSDDAGSLPSGPGKPITEGEAKALSAAEHSVRLAADLRDERHRAELIYMFRKLSTLFLAVVDADLRYAHLQWRDPDGARLVGSPLQNIEQLWLCAPVAEIAEGTRQKCDVCETSILDRHWACTVAGCEWEVCLQCHRAGERRRAARRERYERLQRGETGSWYARPHACGSTSRTARSGAGPTRSGGPIFESAPSSSGTWVQRRNDYAGDETSLQEKVDAVFPPIKNKSGECVPTPDQPIGPWSLFCARLDSLASSPLENRHLSAISLVYARAHSMA